MQINGSTLTLMEETAEELPVLVKCVATNNLVEKALAVPLGNDTWALQSECNYCNHYEQWFLTDDVVYSDIMEDFIPSDEAVRFYTTEEERDIRSDWILEDAMSDHGVWECDRSGKYFAEDVDYWNTADGQRICRSEYEAHYFTCSSCDEIIHNDYYARDGYCDSCAPSRNGSECGVKHEYFTLPVATGKLETRNQSIAGIRRYSTDLQEIQLPLGEMSDAAISQIKGIVNTWFAEHRADQSDDFKRRHWILNDEVRIGFDPDNLIDGKYGGGGRVWESMDWTLRKGLPSIPKRITKMFHDWGRIKVPPTIVNAIGNIAGAEAAVSDKHNMYFTREFNGESSDFYHSGSCWWSDHFEGRCFLKKYCSLGVLTVDKETGKLNGRCWAVGLDDKLKPVPSNADFTGVKNWVLFNFYGTEQLVFTRCFAQIMGMTYKKIKFDINNNVYVNSGNNGSFGYLISDNETCTGIKEIDLSWSRSCGCENE